MNPNSYNSDSPSFDQPQPPQFPVIHPPPQEISIQEMEDLKQQYLDEMKHLINSEYRNEIKICELKQNFKGMSIKINKKEKLLQLEQWANLSTYLSKRFNSFCYDDEDYTIAVTPSLSTKEPDNSLSASPPDSELVSSEVMEIVIPEVGGIDDDILLTIKDDILREKLLNINLLIAKIEALNDLHPHFDDNPLTGSKDSSLKDSINQTDLPNLKDNFVDPIPEMFTDEHTPDYSSPPIFDVYDDHFLEVESNADNVCDDPFDSKGEKIKESKLLIDELDLPCDFLTPSQYDWFNSQYFSKVDALPSTNNEDKVFNPGILIHEKPVKIITRIVLDKKLAKSYASLVFEDFDPPFFEPLFFKVSLS
nr:hypothetical protein [Tanacetum cinerariifolium]